jgi:hypothetical protein
VVKYVFIVRPHDQRPIRNGGNAMSYLDLNPLITALRTSPDHFELVDGWLNHSRSAHSFRFGPNDEVELRATCDCTLLAMWPEQTQKLSESFREWERDYWRPLLINREFASHFAPPGGLRHWLIVLTSRLHQWLLRPPRARHGHAHGALMRTG